MIDYGKNVREAASTSLNSFIRFAASLDAELRENEPMKKHTTFRIGGPADCYAAPQDAGTMEKLVGFCLESGIPFMTLGNGSNLLVSDSGIRGVVLSTKRLCRIERAGDTLICGAGAMLMDVCRTAREESLTGLEFAYGIPGTVGGAVYMNAGAYGGEMKDVVDSTNHVPCSAETGFSKEQLRFGYRKSAYTDTGLVVTQAVFRLENGDRKQISARMDELYERRKSRQPLEYPSAGSVFKRPPGYYAGTLIEGCGLKGLRVGGAMVSEKHANFIVNTGSATCSDVQSLIEKVRDEVFRQTGVKLESEIRMVPQEK